MSARWRIVAVLVGVIAFHVGLVLS